MDAGMVGSEGSVVKKPMIRSFRDLVVYQTSYKSCIMIMSKIIPKLPNNEKYDLKDQLSRACKAVPRLIAEGYAKRHQKMGFQKYLDDANAESNEVIVCLEQVKDIYKIEVELCKELVKTYDVLSRQIYCLSNSWSQFKNKHK